jgi:hypothetical protein
MTATSDWYKKAVLVVVLHRVEADDYLAAARPVAQRRGLSSIVDRDELPRVFRRTTIRAERLRLQARRLADALLELLLIRAESLWPLRPQLLAALSADGWQLQVIPLPMVAFGQR